MFNAFIHQLKLELQKPLPGLDAQFEMAHIKREKIVHPTEGYRPSAVLILLYPNEQKHTSILLIERSIYPGYHSGQIALPGGKAEPEETDLQQTALREFFEETGASATPEIIGALSPMYIPVSRFMVQPYIGFLNSKPDFNINTSEVNQLLELSIPDLLHPETVKKTTLEPTPGITFSTPYFNVQGKILWGATAMMLNELKWIVRNIESFNK